MSAELGIQALNARVTFHDILLEAFIRNVLASMPLTAEALDALTRAVEDQVLRTEPPDDMTRAEEDTFNLHLRDSLATFLKEMRLRVPPRK